MPSFLSSLLKNPEPPRRLENQRNGQIVASELLTAFDSESRRTGLLRHTSLPVGTALIIAPCNAIHTVRMRFAIDVAFVAKDGRVLKVRPDMSPWRMAAAVGAFAVVETPAGTLAQTDTRPGDTLVLVT